MQIVEGLDASSFRKFTLKERLIKSYPQLVFVTPKHRNVSEIVFTENLSAKDIMIDDDLDLSSEGDDDDDLDEVNDGSGDDLKPNEPTVNELQLMYHASMLLKEKIASKQGLQVPWPPLAADISNENVEKIIEPTLFNFLAWTFGFSDEAQID